VALVLLLAAQVVGLLLIVRGLPGVWLQVASLAGFAWYVDFQVVSVVTLGLVALLALLAEIAEFLLGGGYGLRYAGGGRTALGAVAGGLAGALLGLPLPLLGSVFGTMLGAFLGALALELTPPRGPDPALPAGCGPLAGRIVATGMRAAVGVIVLVITLYVVLG
jgi:uncharacterized protein